MSDVPRETELSARYSQVPGMEAFADILATRGVERGLIGPREVPRIWSRHLVNCAVVAQEAAEEMPPGSTVADVGSGAGLPGLVWALLRPDLRVTLIEPLLRRATFLSEAVTELALGERVVVLRARAEDAPPPVLRRRHCTCGCQAPATARLDAPVGQSRRRGARPQGIERRRGGRGGGRRVRLSWRRDHHHPQVRGGHDRSTDDRRHGSAGPVRAARRRESTGSRMRVGCSA